MLARTGPCGPAGRRRSRGGRRRPRDGSAAVRSAAGLRGPRARGGTRQVGQLAGVGLGTGRLVAAAAGAVWAERLRSRAARCARGGAGVAAEPCAGSTPDRPTMNRLSRASAPGELPADVPTRPRLGARTLRRALRWPAACRAALPRRHVAGCDPGHRCPEPLVVDPSSRCVLPGPSPVRGGPGSFGEPTYGSLARADCHRRSASHVVASVVRLIAVVVAASSSALRATAISVSPSPRFIKRTPLVCRPALRT